MSNLCPHTSSGASFTPPLVLPFTKSLRTDLTFTVYHDSRAEHSQALSKAHWSTVRTPDLPILLWQCVLNQTRKLSEIFQCHIYSSKKEAEDNSVGELSFPKHSIKCTDVPLNQYGDGLAWCYGHSSYWISDFSAQCLGDLLPVIKTPALLDWKSHRAPYLPAVLPVRSKTTSWSALEILSFG